MIPEFALNSFLLCGHLQKCVKELEAVVEAKDNEVLRALKASKKSRQREYLNCTNESSTLFANFDSEDKLKQLFVPLNGLERTRTTTDDKPDFQKGKGTIAIDEIDLSPTKDPNTTVLNEKRNSLIVENTPKGCTAFCEVRNADLKDKFSEKFAQESSHPILDGVSEIKAAVLGLANVILPFSSQTGANSQGNAPANPMDNNMVFNIRKESPSSVPVSKPGNSYVIVWYDLDVMFVSNGLCNTKLIYPANWSWLP